LSSKRATPDSDLGVGIQLVLVQNNPVEFEDEGYGDAMTLVKKRVAPIKLITVDEIKTEPDRYENLIFESTELMKNEICEHQ
jgi:hypothetical protein